MRAERFESFAPVADARARVLVLGSMPSVASRQRGQYYGHPHNLFWPIMGALLGAGPELGYDARLRRLRARGVALWDVARRCERAGSADATMRAVVANDVPDLLRRCPRVDRIVCNGRKAEQLCRRLLVPRLPPDVEVRYAPSTSPANAAWSLTDRTAAWRAALGIA